MTNTGEFKVIIDKKINASDTLKAYKVLDVYYSSKADLVRYDFTSDFKTFLSGNDTYKNLTVEQYMDLDKGTATSNPIPSDSPNRYSSGTYISGGYLDSNDFTRLMSAYAAYVRTHSSVAEQH